MDKAEIIPQIINKLCGVKAIMDLVGLDKKVYSAFIELAKKDFLEAVRLLREVETMLQI